jgi:ubiquinone/menaquinone biosynthesis C-methylase UbiE
MKDKIEAFFRTARVSWWNPNCDHDNRFWFFKAQSEYISEQLKKYSVILDGAAALDAGCGRGIHSKLLSELGCSVISMDINPDMLRLTSEVCGSVRIEGSLMAIPFESESFDIITSIGTTMHVPCIGIMMSEVSRVLKRGGIAAVSIANKYSLYVLWATKLNKRLVQHQSCYHRRQFSYWEFKTLIEAYKFSLLDTAGFALIPPLSLNEKWKGTVISPLVSKVASLPFDQILGKFFGCGVTFILKK